MNKKLITILTVITTAILFTACGNNQSKNSTTSKSQSSKVTSNKKTDSKKETEKVGKLISTWQNENGNSISFAADGSYTLTNNNQTIGGLYKVAGKYDQTIVLKMANFNPKTPKMDSYVFVDFQKPNKISFGELGIFTSLNEPKETPKSLYLPNYLTEKPNNTSDLVIGTWSNIGSGDHVYVTTNYNPDGTYESYSDASGMVRNGRYSLTSNEDKIEITTTDNEQSPYKTAYSVNKDFTELTFREPGIVYVYKKLNLPQD